MSAVATAIDTPAEGGHDLSIARMEWRLRLLEETAEIAMQVQRAMRDDIINEQRFHAGTLRDGYCDKLDPVTLAAIGQAPKRRDPAVTLDRAARALRLTLILHGRTEEALRALLAGVATERAARAEARDKAARDHEAAAAAAAERHRVPVGRIREAMRDFLDREIEDDEAVAELERALDERLENDPTYAGRDELPFDETVRRLCADIGLDLDAIASTSDGWIPGAPFAPRRGACFAVPGGKPTPTYAAFHAALVAEALRALE
jgi:hypothetical protein